jgi:hypothetical protein
MAIEAKDSSSGTLKVLANEGVRSARAKRRESERVFIWFGFLHGRVPFVTRRVRGSGIQGSDGRAISPET